MISSVIQGGNNKVSMTRVTTLIVIVSIILIFIAHNVVAMFNGGGFISLGTTEAAILIGCMGLKVTQRFIEGARPLENKELPKDKTE